MLRRRPGSGRGPGRRRRAGRWRRPRQADPKDVQPGRFDGPFGKYDQAQLQRGYKVYQRGLLGLPLDEPDLLPQPRRQGRAVLERQVSELQRQPGVKAIAAGLQVPTSTPTPAMRSQRPATTADHFGAALPQRRRRRGPPTAAPLPPDMSLLAKAREGGPSYIYSIVTGLRRRRRAGLTVPPGKYYNPYFPGDLTSFWNGDPKNVPAGRLHLHAPAADRLTGSPSTTAPVHGRPGSQGRGGLPAPGPPTRKMEERKQTRPGGDDLPGPVLGRALRQLPHASGARSGTEQGAANESTTISDGIV